MATIERRPVGFSNAAETLERVQRRQAERNAETVTFSNHSLNDQLIDVFVESSQPGQEGEGTEVVSRDTLRLAKEVVESLPVSFRTPEISGEPDGHVNLEWYVHPRRILNVSVNPDGRLHWAALIGDEDPRGSCRFHGETPKTLIYWIGRVCNG